MWYKNEVDLDMSKPIIAVEKNRPEEVMLLLPQIAKKSYLITGYNWFKITGPGAGTYNSCCFFETPEAAVKQYSREYDISNTDLLEIK